MDPQHSRRFEGQWWTASRHRNRARGLVSVLLDTARVMSTIPSPASTLAWSNHRPGLTVPPRSIQTIFSGCPCPDVLRLLPPWQPWSPPLKTI